MARKSIFAKSDVKVRKPGLLREMLEDYGQASALAEIGLHSEALAVISQRTRKILVVSRNSLFPLALRRNALGLAERLGSAIVAVNVCEAADGEQQGEVKVRFLTKAKAAAKEFELEAAASGLAFSHAVLDGETDRAVEKLCGELRRVEFVLTVKPQKWEKNLRVSMSVFEVAC